MSTVTSVEMPAIFEKIGFKQYLPPHDFDKVTINNRTFKLGPNCGFSSGGTDIHVLELASPKPDAKPIKDFWGAAGCGLWFQVHALENKGYVAQWNVDDGEWKIEQPRDPKLAMPSVDSAQDDVRMLTNALELMTFLHERNLKI